MLLCQTRNRIMSIELVVLAVRRGSSFVYFKIKILNTVICTNAVVKLRGSS